MNTLTLTCTTNLHALRFPFTLRIDPSEKTGFITPATALLSPLRVVDQRRCVKRMGTLESETIRKINRLLKTFLGI